MLKHNVVPPLQPHFQTKNFSVTTDKAVVKENALRKLLFLFLFFKKKKKKCERERERKRKYLGEQRLVQLQCPLRLGARIHKR